MAFTDDYALAIQDIFRNKVKVCIVKVAHAVVDEFTGAMNARNVELRRKLAVRILNNPDEYVERFSFSAVSDGLLAGGYGDAELQARIESGFSDIAGCWD